MGLTENKNPRYSRVGPAFSQKSLSDAVLTSTVSYVSIIMKSPLFESEKHNDSKNRNSRMKALQVTEWIDSLEHLTRIIESGLSYYLSIDNWVGSGWFTLLTAFSSLNYLIDRQHDTKSRSPLFGDNKKKHAANTNINTNTAAETLSILCHHRGSHACTPVNRSSHWCTPLPPELLLYGSGLVSCIVAQKSSATWKYCWWHRDY